MDYRYGNHAIYNIEYHLAWVRKYRYKILEGELGQRVRDIGRQVCEAYEIHILSGVVG